MRNSIYSSATYEATLYTLADHIKNFIKNNDVTTNKNNIIINGINVISVDISELKLRIIAPKAGFYISPINYGGLYFVKDGKPKNKLDFACWGNNSDVTSFYNSEIDCFNIIHI